MLRYDDAGVWVDDVFHPSDHPRLLFAEMLKQYATPEPNIHPTAVIGSQGFGFERDADQHPVRLPHIGGVKLGADVEVGAHSCIDKGTVGDTVIGDRVKIDNLVHIAHNVTVGDDTLIAASAMIAGSVTIGERVWIGPGAVVSNGVTIGDDAKVSLGAVVVKDVLPGETVTGNFAMPHIAFLRRMRG